MTQLTLGQRIAARRKLLGMSQESLAEHMELSRQAVSKWEADGAIPEIDKLIALAKIFDVSIDWLLGLESKLAEKGSEEKRCCPASITIIIQYEQ